MTRQKSLQQTDVFTVTKGWISCWARMAVDLSLASIPGYHYLGLLRSSTTSEQSML